MKKIIPYIAITFAMLCWAGAGIAVKEALVVFTPLTLIVLRFSIAVLLMMFIGLVFRKSEVLGLQRADKKDIPLFMLGGLFQPFLYFIFETYTYQSFTSPTIAEAMLSTQPIMAPLLAFVLLREQVTRNNILGIIVSTVGMLILLLVGVGEYQLGSSWGILLSVMTVSMSVGYTIILRRIPRHYSSLSIVFYVQSFALLLFYLLWGGIQLLSSSTSELLNLSISGHMKAVYAVIYLAVFASVIAFVLFCYTVRQIGVTRANVFNNIRPVFTALLMWLLFDEVLPVAKFIGILLIVIGLFVSQRK